MTLPTTARAGIGVRPARFAYAVFALLLSMSLLCAAPARAGLADLFSKPDPLASKEVEASLTYLLDMCGSSGTASFDSAKLAPLLDFTFKTDPAKKPVKLADRAKAEGVVERMVVNVPLSRVLQYAYNPDIPAYVMAPSTVRLSNWEEGSDILEAGVRLDKLLQDLAAPIVLKGVEHEEVTPETNTGAYYSYDLYRLFVLMPYKGRAVFISVGKQKGPSEVGKKGAVLKDETWSYVYTQEEGLTKGGMSWMDTYMYDSSSVCVMFQETDYPPRTANVVFKWLSAGWAGLNVVNGDHIRQGMTRFSRSFKALLESNKLPSPRELAEATRTFSTMSDAELARRLEPYARDVARKGEKADLPDDIRQQVAGGRYVESLTRRERIAILIKEFLKAKVGEDSLMTAPEQTGTN